MKKNIFLSGVLVLLLVFEIAYATEVDMEALKNAPLPPAQKAAILRENGYDVNTIMSEWGFSIGNEFSTEVPTEDPIETGEETQPEEKNYLFFGRPAVGFKSGMTDNDMENWEEIVTKYEAGDDSWNRDTNLTFRMSGNFCSYVDEDGNINGWLYAVDGIGGYVPVTKGQVMETGLRSGATYCSPDGIAYQVGADGKLVPCGTVDWVKYGEYIGPSAGYHYDGGYFWSTDENGNFKRYDYATAPDSVLEKEGYFRSGDAIMPINDEYRMFMAIRDGELSEEEAARIMMIQQNDLQYEYKPNKMPEKTYDNEDYYDVDELFNGEELFVAKQAIKGEIEVNQDFIKHIEERALRIGLTLESASQMAGLFQKLAK